MKRTLRILFFMLPLLWFVAGGSPRISEPVVTGNQKTAYAKGHTLRSSEGLQATTIRITESNTPGRYPAKYQKAGFTGEPDGFVCTPPAHFRIASSSGITPAQQRLPRYLALRRLLI